MTETVYQIVLKRSAVKDMRKMPVALLDRIRASIAALANNPYPAGVESMKGYLHCYRIRLGDYRIVYEVAQQIRIITVIRIGHRKNVYRGL